MLSSNIMGNSINLSYILYSSFVSDTVSINYGDSQIQTTAINMSNIYLKKCILFEFLNSDFFNFKVTFQAYSVPKFASTISSNLNSSFILLNTEIQNDTFLFGFDVYTALGGTITIEVI
jgi:hypothetical protein